ncbi:adenosylhomocysteinase [Candidatus Peribacteria bacterium RIFOXYC2_FULL_55_14]|nr:MAG: Adenosylhomocysteinase [Candidatus Peribacteria bacterium GW2011_GWB1_54_5]KKW38968.1 MAG: Adenosylhomocysteinase [Candidatus Peribacteria bacterium GW2011_GWC2_54_8]OGJ71132.1 MAG: adenosylhomocysteinase [Candidatus Peribacteria bacterium RIFOXYA1_FULL_56_14]OGJ73766.1 MAG: adenosylhomocysteinase [Candidatus Peribacteria bacterium RIFOXYB1_FULL_54_35]OGJ74894.1 MAG: adenosylhomocysteinase [Candidatus Peribacteria bacterium RIFOXYA2_FULL_55_28]OGJ77182.1 MAG: adenosylhomocysteinase [Ca
MSHVKDPQLAEQGRLNLEIAERRMGALLKLRRRITKDQTFAGLTIGMALHVTKETGVLVRTFTAGGAKVAVTSCNPLSTQDDIAAALAEEDGVLVWAYKGETTEDYYKFLTAVIDTEPDITIDDGCDLVTEIHQKHPDLLSKVIGGCEETTTGINRLRAMVQDGALKMPMIAVNDNKTKHLMDNYYGTGQSTFDGILRSTNILVAGKTVVVLGYGSCGKGVALRAKGLGAQVIVTEVDAFCGLQAAMDGNRVMRMEEAAPLGDLFVTVTGNYHVIRTEHMQHMKDTAVLCNSGHFDNEIDMKGLETMVKRKRRVRHYLDEYLMKDGRVLYVAGEGRLVNLASAEGHPSEVMSLSFCGQALACEYLVKHRGKLPKDVITLPPEIDAEIAQLQLTAMGLTIDKLTPEQVKYLASWQEGT